MITIIEAKHRMAVGRGFGEKEMRICQSISIKFQLYKMNKFSRFIIQHCPHR
jgi:hypothetical protein